MSIKINKNSWHYRFIKWGVDGGRMPRGLCEYTRTLMFACTMACFAGIMACVAIWFMFVTPVQFWLVQFDVIQPPMDDIFGLGIAAQCIWLLMACICGVLKYIDCNRKRPSKCKAPKQPSIIMAYINAKKERVCPRIEFV